jgi:hypothetical protein
MSHIPLSFIATLTPVTKKHLGVQDTAALRSTPQGLSITGAQKSNPGGHRAPPLAGSRIPRAIRAVRPTVVPKQAISALQGACHLPSVPCISSVARPVVSTTQRPHRAGKILLKPTGEKPCVGRGAQGVPIPTARLPETGSKPRPPSIKPISAVSLPKPKNNLAATKIPSVYSASATVKKSSQTVQRAFTKAGPTTGGTSSRIPQWQSRAPPSVAAEVQTSSQTFPDEVVSPRSRQHALSQGKPAKEGRSVIACPRPVMKAPSVRPKLRGVGNPTRKPAPQHIITDIPSTTGRSSSRSEPREFTKAKPPKTGGTSSRIPRWRTHAPPSTQVEIQTRTSSQTFCNEVVASRASKQALGQGKPVLGGPVTKGPKPIVKVLSSSQLYGMKNIEEDISFPPDPIVCPTPVSNASSPACTPRRSRPFEPATSKESPIKAPTHDTLIPLDMNCPPHTVGCRLRRTPWRPRRQRAFLTSTPRASISSPLSNPEISFSGIEIIAHTHTPNSSQIGCFEGCELRQVLDFLDMELDHAAMLCI